MLSFHADYLKEKSQPNLSRERKFTNNNSGATKREIDNGESRRVIHKSVQSWLKEVEWPELNKYEDYVGKNYTKINHPILWKLNKKISLATQLRTDIHTSGTDMQVTNYGLGGICERHIDPVGMMELKDVKNYLESTGDQNLEFTGDMVGTFMAWLGDTEAGGATVYVYPKYEKLITPEKGAALFWYDLLSDGMRDLKSMHGGCPVLKGSKWILNKWLYMYDNFNKFPCRLQPKMRYNPPSRKNYF